MISRNMTKSMVWGRDPLVPSGSDEGLSPPQVNEESLYTLACSQINKNPTNPNMPRARWVGGLLNC